MSICICTRPDSSRMPKWTNKDRTEFNFFLDFCPQKNTWYTLERKQLWSNFLQNNLTSLTGKPFGGLLAKWSKCDSWTPSSPIDQLHLGERKKSKTLPCMCCQPPSSYNQPQALLRPRCLVHTWFQHRREWLSTMSTPLTQTLRSSAAIRVER